ncbi:phospholipase D-like domain-containing protein [Photobacterium sp. SDRW27]|uniref:phospholipase D-like domain-containing protein n=1 Tax=Photobacterium obscurum TaxID=2829490 RepID=UPI0022447B84|nr:phospholipase D-like domain-containing protein [Photobacterium obscurum]MCW8330768.1 phospholipase D-like domain-containing protein [Photobacterium obscurum]
MTKFEVQDLLLQSFEDSKLDNSERRSLAELLASAELKADELAYLRNQSFQLVQKTLREGGDGLSALKWLEQVIKQLDKARGGDCVAVAESWFSPGNSCLNGIKNQLRQAVKSVDICVFTIADDYLTEAIVATYKRGVRVRIITDNDKINDIGSDIEHLSRQGIEVKVDDTRYHMHHKFALFDNERLINGSFNWTRSASQYNSEDLTLTDDKRHVQAFSRHFEQLWRSFPNYSE